MRAMFRQTQRQRPADAGRRANYNRHAICQIKAIAHDFVQYYNNTRRYSWSIKQCPSGSDYFFWQN